MRISRMESYVSSMSNLRRMEDAQPEYKLIDLQTVASSLYDSAKIVCAKNGKELILQNDMPVSQLSLDGAFVSQVSNNLISNAVRYNTFILGGDVILIENDLLADALNALPQDNRDILLMYWFLEMADREIAERMNLARRTINNRRLKSYRLLKELMGGDTDA